MNPEIPAAPRPQTIAHLSDLHLGRSPREFSAASALRDALQNSAIDHVIVTGDVVDHGRDAEFAQFIELFRAFQDVGRLTVVPGNHDRLGDAVARKMMDGFRVDCVRRPGLFILRIDTTGPHNRFFLAGHGKIDDTAIDETDRLLADAGTEDLVVVALHHHPLPLPEDLLSEKLSTLLHLPYAAELSLGKKLVERLHGRCDLILHGHRHVPTEKVFSGAGRELAIYNAGSSTELGRVRIFSHDRGKLLGRPSWLQANIHTYHDARKEKDARASSSSN